MCRNIKVLYNFEPPATDDEMHAAALQFIRKVSGTTKPSQVNQAVFDDAVEDVTTVVRTLLSAMRTSAPPKNREAEAEKRRRKAAQRFAS